MSKNPYINEELEFLAETAEKFAQKIYCTQLFRA